MLRKVMIITMLLVTLASLPGCIIHDPGYYPYDRAYYYDPAYSYYYGPYIYTPFWFSGYYFLGDFGRGHVSHWQGGFDGRGGRGGGGGRR